MKRVNPTHFEEIAPFPRGGGKHDINVVIETPRDIRHKYALNPDYGIFELKQTIAEGLTWPYDYGFVPQTLGEDGDPLDVVFLCDEATFPGCLVKGRLLGVIGITKDGEENDRLVACAERFDGIAQSTDEYDEIDDLPKRSCDSLVRFLVEYSADQGHKIEFTGIGSRAKAMKCIKQGQKAFKKKNKRSA